MWESKNVIPTCNGQEEQDNEEDSRWHVETDLMITEWVLLVADAPNPQDAIQHPHTDKKTKQKEGRKYESAAGPGFQLFFVCEQSCNR